MIRPVNGANYQAAEEQYKDFIRCSHEMPCDVCGEVLWKHLQPLKETCPTMIEDCAGKWWKT